MADISGPGELSKRTDLGVLKQSTQPPQHYTGGTYGSNKQTFEQGSSAALAGNPFSSLPPINAIALDAPTMRPDEAGTTGIDIGDGGGSELMMDRPTTRPGVMSTLQKLAMFDDTGEAELIYQASRR